MRLPECCGLAWQGIRIALTDGVAHSVDSNEMAFQLAAQYAFRQGFNKAAPVILEPIMAVEACPQLVTSLRHFWHCAVTLKLNAKRTHPVQLVLFLPMRQSQGFAESEVCFMCLLLYILLLYRVALCVLDVCVCQSKDAKHIKAAIAVSSSPAAHACRCARRWSSRAPSLAT